MDHPLFSNIKENWHNWLLVSLYLTKHKISTHMGSLNMAKADITLGVCVFYLARLRTSIILGKYKNRIILLLYLYQALLGASFCVDSIIFSGKGEWYCLTFSTVFLACNSYWISWFHATKPRISPYSMLRLFFFLRYGVQKQSQVHPTVALTLWLNYTFLIPSFPHCISILCMTPIMVLLLSWTGGWSYSVGRWPGTQFSGSPSSVFGKLSTTSVASISLSSIDEASDSSLSCISEAPALC